MVINKNILIKKLNIAFVTGERTIPILHNVNLELESNKFTAILGESGCGKSVLMQGLLGILPVYAKIEGEICFAGRDVLNKEMAYPTAKELGIIPQNPGEAMNPVRKIGKQFQDLLELAGLEDAEDSLKLDCLKLFGLEEGARVLKAYPFELSGGMLQRVLCALSYCLKPKWILADEPTKGLDEKTSAVVYENLLKIKSLKECSMVIVTHDIELATKVCDRIVVMYAGEVLEITDVLLENPLHPYTQGFVKAMPEYGYQTIPGTPPEAGKMIDGCVFAERCKYCTERCRKEKPKLYDKDKSKVRCFLYAGA